MKLRVVAIILLLSLLLFFGFKKVSPNKNKEQSTNIEQLSIIKYIPENNKLLFISNLDSFNIVNKNEKDKNPTNKDNLFLIKDSILDYLGIDLGNNKLEDIYNNELIISTFENNKKLKDDILIVFKIKPEKTIDDLLNLPNKIDQIDEIISINRENKINFLNYIYRTDDNYIIASSDKKLIKNSINSSNDFREKKFQYQGELFGLKNQKNILLTKKFGESIIFDKEIFTNKNEDIVATRFDLKNKHLILKSYLNVFAGQVTKGSTLEQQRVSIVNEYIKLRVVDALVYGIDIKFLTLNGFFPQSHGVDKWSEFIKIDQDELEKKVKDAIKIAKKKRSIGDAA